MTPHRPLLSMMVRGHEHAEGTGPNKQVTPAQLEQAIGPEALDTLSRDELLATSAAGDPHPMASFDFGDLPDD
jgi:hypothetical protein